MPDTWQTIEQAAVTLGLSVRTVNRHITGGKLESRLFEGRREVLVSLPDPVRPADSTKSAAPQRAASAAPSASGTTDTPPAPESTVNFTMGAAANDRNDAASSNPSANAAADKPAYESVRRAMFDSESNEKPLDLRTMLTLADSADDKASLAVAAYQTLARTSEMQVHSLRRVALGAWAAVGVMAAGAIMAVGWGTYRLTTSEGTSSYLRAQVTDQKTEINHLTDERDRARNELVRLQIESARLQDRLSQLADAQSVAEIARYALRTIKQNDLGSSPIATQPTVAASATQPTLVEGPIKPDTHSPTTQPAHPAGGIAAGPVTQPASKPALTGQRPTYITNSREPFDPR
ncbi:hypothetical protein [Humisphaera borealis]|uniref:Helix-turn-helix domain-containing protein n=1 Tax=Humisphaera borealis TaxID=2807512 RepID=A0A7M2WSL2_9BACT|nr:hypothetical protein [Humisphaera borealis]QOV87580.1 hypothetical protein IPV69_14920 [Humisphaera borealis]